MKDATPAVVVPPEVQAMLMANAEAFLRSPQAVEQTKIAISRLRESIEQDICESVRVRPD